MATPSPEQTFEQILCPNKACNAWLADAHILRGRLRLKCSNCAKITILVFRQRKRSNGRANNY